MVKIREGIAFPDHACPTVLDSVAIVHIARGIGTDLDEEKDSAYLRETFEFVANVCVQRCGNGACILSQIASEDSDSEEVIMIVGKTADFLAGARGRCHG